MSILRHTPRRGLPSVSKTCPLIPPPIKEETKTKITTKKYLTMALPPKQFIDNNLINSINLLLKYHSLNSRKQPVAQNILIPSSLSNIDTFF